MEEIMWKSALASLMIAVSWKLMLEPLWESLRDDINLNRAKKDLPVLAKELKLSHTKGDGFGRYHGSWNNHKIRIEPNNFQASICMQVKGNPQFSAVHMGISSRTFHVNTLFHHLKKLIITFIPDYPVVQSEYPPFSFEDGELDAYFQERRLLGDGGKSLVGNPEFKNALKVFISKNRRIVKDMVVGQEAGCSLWLGGSTGKTRLYSVTGRQVKEMLPEMLPVVEVIEKLCMK